MMFLRSMSGNPIKLALHYFGRSGPLKHIHNETHAESAASKPDRLKKQEGFLCKVAKVRRVFAIVAQAAHRGLFSKVLENE